MATAFQSVNPRARLADVGDGAPTVRDSDVIVAIGSKAFELAKAQPGSAAIVATAVLSPQPGGSHPITAVPMESRAADALDALRALAPEARKVLALHPPGDSPMLAEARAAARARGLTVEFRALADLSGLEQSMRELLQGQQALWLLPNPRLARPEVAKFLVATCLERKLPLIGFLAGMAQVGALVAVAADFEAIGREAAKLASDMAARAPSARAGSPSDSYPAACWSTAGPRTSWGCPASPPPAPWLCADRGRSVKRSATVAAKPLRPGAADWQLFFQLDSDDALNVMWGDSGML